MQRRVLRRSVSMLSILLALTGVEAAAQQARSFEQLQVLVKQDDTVTVVSTAGEITRGKVVELTNASLRLSASGMVREFSERDLQQIRQRRGDSLGNGAKYGALIGGGFGVLVAAVGLALTDDCVGCAVAVAAAYTAMGAGVGVGVDALIRREQIIFAGPQSSLNRLQIKPLLFDGRRGVSATWSF